MSTPFYEVVGEGPTCLFPTPTGPAWYQQTLPPQLFDRLRVVLIEPSGTGRSEGDPAAASVSTVVQDLEQVRDDLNAEEVIVFGHSANGLIALAYAAAHPDVTTGVIGVATPPPGGVEREVVRRYWAENAEPERKARFEELFAAADEEPEYSDEQNRIYRRADALRRWYDMSLDPSTVDTYSQVDPAWVRRVLIDDTAAQDWPSLLSRLSAPVLLLLGTYDFVVPPVLWDKEIHIAKLTKEAPAQRPPTILRRAGAVCGRHFRMASAERALGPPAAVGMDTDACACKPEPARNAHTDVSARVSRPRHRSLAQLRVREGGASEQWHTARRMDAEDARVTRTAETYDRIALEYEASTTDASPAVEALRSTLAGCIPHGGRILDVGCGPGRDVEWFRRHGFNAIGLDRSSRMVSRAGLRAPAIRSDMRWLPIGASSVHGLWSCASLLHVPGSALSATLREWRRVLRSDGYLAMTTSTGGSEGVEIVPYPPERGPKSTSQLERWFANHAEADLLSALNGAGFEIERQEPRQGHVAWLDLLCSVGEARP